MDFDKIRWKLVDDMTPQEVDVVMANKEKWSNEEKDAFRELELANTPLPDPENVLDENINRAVENEDENQPDPAENPETVPQQQQVTTPLPATPAQPVQQVTPTVPQTQEQLDAYLEKKRTEWDAQGKTKADQAEEANKIKQFFDAGYTPKDWNEYTNAMYQKIAPIIEQNILKTIDDRNAKFAAEQEKIRATQKEVYDQFEKEFDTLSTQGLIPKRTDSNYKDIKDQILKIGDEHGKRTVADAYRLWSIIPTEHGGGLVVDGKPNPAQQKQNLQQQKTAAGRIQSGKGVAGAQKKGAPAWHHIHNTSMDDLLAEATTRSLPA